MIQVLFDTKLYPTLENQSIFVITWLWFIPNFWLIFLLNLNYILHNLNMSLSTDNIFTLLHAIFYPSLFCNLSNEEFEMSNIFTRTIQIYHFLLYLENLSSWKNVIYRIRGVNLSIREVIRQIHHFFYETSNQYH